MKRGACICLFAGVFLLMAAGYPSVSRAGVDVHIGINVPLPAVVISAPPAVVVIPRTYVYYVPEVEVDILFYRGYWYRPHSGYWYRAAGYNGPWVSIVATKVPRVLIDLSPGFRQAPPGHQRIPYGQLKKNWRTWERDRYWDKHGAKERFKEEKREYKEEKRDHREDRDRGRGRDR